LEDVEIQSEDIPGLQVASEGAITVALDINVTPELRLEGIAREFVNRIQNLRKESNFEVTDKIILRIVRHPELNEAMDKFGDYIGHQTLASRVELVDQLPDDETAKLVEIDKGIETFIQVEKEIM
jgi:isoleucyl-tRNA synthetase